VRDILWGILREHTLVGFMTAFLLGDGPKLATMPQAVQLFCGSVLGLLFLSCAQLRYMWLGATLTPVPAYAQGTPGALMDRMPFLSGVAVMAALVGYPCILVARWMFFLANTAAPLASTSRQERYIIFILAWSLVTIATLALAIGAVNMAGTMDALLLETDVMVGWMLAALVLWLLCEPVALVLFSCIILALKWCTSFEDLPEVKAEVVKQQKQQAELYKEQQKQAQAAKTAKSPTPPALQLKGPAKKAA